MKFKKAVFYAISEAALAPEYWKKLESSIENKIFVEKDSPEINKELSDADCLCVAFGTIVSKEMIEKAPSLKFIGVIATAFGKIDVESAKSKNIPVSNLAGYSTESVAEFTIAAILETIRGLETGKQRGRGGSYDESGIKAWELKNKNFAVLGLGHIGQRVAELAKGFGANVSYWSRIKKDNDFQYQEIDNLIKNADFLSINLAQTPETEKIMDEKRFESLKPNAVVINTCPMELIDVDGLCKRLAKGDITFMFDHSDETDPEDLKKMHEFKNCIIYPPMAYITDEAKVIKQEMFVSNIENFLDSKPSNVVNK